MSIRTTNQSGFSLMEILAVVGISAVALVGVMAVGSRVSLHNQVDSATRLLTKVLSEANAYNKIKGSYTPLNCNLSDPTCYFVQQKIVPLNQKNPFGGDVLMNALSPTELKVSLQRVPQSACMELILGMNNKSSFKKIELMNPDQKVITDSFGNPVCVDPPPPEPEPPTDLPGVTFTPTDCAAGKDGFAVTSIDQFPVTADVAAGVCSWLPKLTVSFTVGS